MTNPHEPVTPNPDGTLRFSDGSQLKIGPDDRPKCPWCGDVGCELHDAGEAWRLGHDNNCNVRVAFPSTEEDCNCHSPAAPNEIEKQLTLGDGTYVEGYTLGWENGYAQAGGEPELKRLLDRYTEELATERAKVQQLQDTVRGFEIPEPKPPRIRTLELPGEINPDTHELSVVFAIVLDRMGDLTVDADQLDRLADETGARTAVSFPFEIQIGED